ncbi:MAG: glycosyltransferase [Vicinamibacterales bacterium]
MSAPNRPAVTHRTSRVVSMLPRRESVRPPRILLYSHDTFGLGNIRRTLLLADALRGAYPRAAVLIVTGSPVIQSFSLPAGVDYVKLPCLDRTDADKYSARFINVDVAAIRRAIVTEAVVGFAPDLMVVDKRPSGIDGELLGALEALEGSARRPKIVLGIRDILDAPDRTRASLERSAAMETIERHYDEVWIYGEPAVFDAVREYDFPDSVATKTHYCGYLKRPTLAGARAPGPPRVLVTAGGGADGATMVTAYLNDLLTLPRSIALETTVVFGPEMPPECRDQARARFGSLADVTFVDFELDMTSRYAEADVVVSMAGYNTVCELLSFARRAVLVPRTTPVLEQALRAQALTALGYFEMVLPEDLRPGVLMDKVLETLASDARPRPDIDLDGLPRILSRVRRLLGHEEPVA